VHLKVCRADAELGGTVTGVVDTSAQMHVINLGAEIDLAPADEQTTGHPVDVRVLQEVAGSRPLGSPRDEEDHLLAGAEVVDDGSNSLRSERPSSIESSEGLGNGGVGDGSRVVPQTLGGDTGTSLDVGSREIRRIADLDELLNTGVTAASASNSGSGAKVAAREGVETDHANAEVGLVGIDVRPLGGIDSGGPTS